MKHLPVVYVLLFGYVLDCGLSKNIADSDEMRERRAAPAQTKTVIQTLPPKVDDSWKRIHLTPLEIATIVALCLLVVGAFLFCIYKYCAYCWRNNKSPRNTMRVREADERITSPRSLEEVKRDHRGWGDRRGSSTSSTGWEDRRGSLLPVGRWDERRGSSPSVIGSKDGSRSGSTVGLFETAGNNRWAFA
ncbi:uncharacterized protein LOC125664796 [Ostrea edulis]|uniref:uncharacterized protein LOC125664796 n=1 Tax=Ostrea edulis TaxID=37623 RepID=UPI002094E76C|nr:uncharacterized protein LOC125664796 [Ostrea edulis]XP_048753561.1 uncharacterized protein LOC125664796 [Ostrea edulis]